MKFNGNYQLIGQNINIGYNVKIGDRSVIYDNVEIADNTIIANDCIIGEPAYNYYTEPEYSNIKTSIGKNCLIRSHAIIYCGNQIGDNVTTGHRIMLRESNNIGNNCRIGNYTELHGNVSLGEYVRLHSSVCIVENARIGNYVWIAPGTILTNDYTPPSNNLISPIIGDYTFIAVNSIILPGIEIGKHCLVGASTLVTKNAEDYSVIVGTPGKVIADIRDFKVKGLKHYPWPYNFDKGMPWQGIDYNEWLKIHEK